IEINLRGANLSGVNHSEADLSLAKLIQADLGGANLSGAILGGANLCRANLWKANLSQTNLSEANLSGAKLWEANLSEAYLIRADLSGADLGGANLNGATFVIARADGATVIAWCQIDRRTDFTGVALTTAQVDPGLLPLLESNIRQIQWSKWYKEHRVLAPFMEHFWKLTDYGLKTYPIVGWFFGFAIFFAVLYWAGGIIAQTLFGHPLVADLSEGVPGWLEPVRAVYFSVVTMTTLGFGDMYAVKSSVAGHLLVMAQVLLGYVLLGALVTRFAVLFSTAGPPDMSLMEKEESRSEVIRCCKRAASWLTRAKKPRDADSE
ncbi:MAG: hypothetical protein QG656_2709, partial [Candidatus Hydrogenedentes bacterium]|nr:hypothetical protein [Candidatus Hydrogenedentota bacterium]